MFDSISRGLVPLVAAIAGTAFTPGTAASAEAAAGFPDRPITLVLPFPPGGSADTIARSLAEKLQQQVKQPVLIENRPGAGGNIATRHVVQARADGYTLLAGVTGALAIAPHLYTLDYNPAEDLKAVSLVFRAPAVVVADPNAGIDSIEQLIEQAKAKPGALSYATNGVGTSHHLTAELFKEVAGVDLQNVPYKGTPAALQDIVGGRIPIGFTDLTASIPLVASGKLKALATTGTTRSPALPDVPTMAEAGVPGYAVQTWMGVFAPKGTPDAIVDKLSAEIATALAVPEIRERAQSQGIEVASSTPEELRDMLGAETATWKRVVSDAQITVE